jgi:SRSO17 transposase
MLESTFSTQFSELTDRLEEQFSRCDLFRQAESYLRGLLSQVDRKNSWQLAEATGADTPHGFQRLLGRARWDADEVRDDLLSYVAEHLSDPQGVLIIDETGFLKKGNKSAGVSRQYSGTAGRVENCQIGVFMAYRSRHGHALVDRELYLPKCWIEDKQRSTEAGIPAGVEFATKPALARRMLRRAFGSDLQASWVTADEIYGRDTQFRKLLEKQGIGYVVAVSCQQRLFLDGCYGRVDEHVQAIPKRQWKKLSCGTGSKGERFYQWTFVPFPFPTDKGMHKGLLVRRSLKDSDELAYYFTHAPEGANLKKLVQVAGSRWAIEECFEQTKGETGLDEYEVRSWTGWHRHITLSMFAHAFLSVVRNNSNSQTKKRALLATSYR